MNAMIPKQNLRERSVKSQNQLEIFRRVGDVGHLILFSVG